MRPEVFTAMNRRPVPVGIFCQIDLPRERGIRPALALHRFPYPMGVGRRKPDGPPFANASAVVTQHSPPISSSLRAAVHNHEVGASPLREATTQHHYT